MFNRKERVVVIDKAKMIDKIKTQIDDFLRCGFSALNPIVKEIYSRNESLKIPEGYLNELTKEALTEMVKEKSITQIGLYSRENITGSLLETVSIIYAGRSNDFRMMGKQNYSNKN